jgi:DNA-binding NarL/FixJ family response regulator
MIDLEMPELDGAEALRELALRGEGVPSIVFTVFDTDDRIVDALSSGARGYLLKGAPREEIFHAIRIVAGGGSLLQPIVASRLLTRLKQRDTVHEKDALTPREMEVLNALAAGRTNKEIASAFSISERTAKFHVSSILSKLGAGNRTEAVAIATRLRLL